jgi:hypothetical protein
MSHFTTIQTQIKDIDALRDACAELGLTLAENAVARGYGSLTRRGEYVIQIPSGPYDIALSKQPDGTYELATDWWAGHTERAVGKNYGTLLQLYGVHKASREARRRGYTVRRQQHRDGAIKLLIGGVR